MAQMTGHTPFTGAHVQYSTGTAWVTFSGSMSSVEVGGGERNVGEAYTADGDIPLLGGGKRGPLEVTVNYVYAEGSTGATGMAEICRGVYETAGGGTFNVRWAPKGSDTGNFLYTTNTATDGTHLVFPGYPVGEVEPGDPIANELSLSTSMLIKGTIA